MTEHRSPRRVSRVRTLAAAASILAALSVWTGCNKDADAPLAPLAGNGVAAPSAVGDEATGEVEQQTGADNQATESSAIDSGDAASAPSDQAATPHVEESTAPASVPGEAPGPSGAQQPQPQQQASKQPQPPPVGSALPQPPPPAQVDKPEVVLSQHHAQTCLVGVGDEFPSLVLPDLEGIPRELAQLRGDRMTILVFWTAQGLYAREQFSRIMHECHDRYAKLGVRVVAINVGDSPQVVEELAAKHGVTIPCLLDADGQAFRQAATGLLPRTYLLDAAGKIVWFDLEYSRSQRRELHNAVYYQLKQNGA
jgi:peroxiredoxin